MNLMEFQSKIDETVDNTPGNLLDTPITVHTGGDSWEQIVDVVFCQGCNQYHIISERLPDGHVDPLKGSFY